MRIGDIILQRRKELGMTQKQLAERLNVTDRSVSRWERGVNLPDVETLKTIASVLDVPISYFYEDVQEKEINYIEEYDYERIKKYKLRFITPLVLLILSSAVTEIAKLLLINVKTEQYENYIFSVSSNIAHIVMNSYDSSKFKIALISLAISVILITVSLVLYTRNAVEFQCFYKGKMFQEAYIDIYKQSRLFYALWLCIAILIMFV